jgi:energy-coupling factor transporter ATP-binding protein EcfA2
MYQIAAKVGSVFQNPRTQFFNVDTDSEIAFGIENEAIGYRTQRCANRDGSCPKSYSKEH